MRSVANPSVTQPLEVTIKAAVKGKTMSAAAYTETQMSGVILGAALRRNPGDQTFCGWGPLIFSFPDPKFSFHDASGAAINFLQKVGSAIFSQLLERVSKAAPAWRRVWRRMQKVRLSSLHYIALNLEISHWNMHKITCFSWIVAITYKVYGYKLICKPICIVKDALKFAWNGIWCIFTRHCNSCMGVNFYRKVLKYFTRKK